MASILFEEVSLAPIRRKQLLNNIVDGLAKVRPGTVYAEIPRSATSYEEGYRKISYANFANAINGLAHWLHDTLGHVENFPTVAYIGPNDFRYNALMLAAVKAGYKMFFSSPRNSIPAHANLFKILDCKVLITASPTLPMVPAIIEATGVSSIECPDVDELLDNVYPHYPFNKTFEQARKEPLVVLHTSGTTGFPKPIVWNHDWVASWSDWLAIAPPDGYTRQTALWTSTRLLNTLPPFHAGGIFMTLLNAVFNQTPLIYPLAGVPLSTQVALEALKYVKADSAFFPPSFVEEVGKNPEMLDFLVENIDVLIYGGGDVSQATGNKISKRLKLSMLIGSTESGVYPTLFPSHKWPSDDWKYFHFNPNAGIELRPHSEGRYEAVLTRNLDPEKVEPIFSVFPSLNEWGTHDLYAPHPSIPDMWLYTGRSDDIIVLLTGEKTNPVSMEQQISHHPEVRGALVVGTHRFQTALLIELISPQTLSTSERAEAIERIWPIIQEANQECPRHAKVAKSHVFFTSPDKPMARAGKGTIQRQPTFDLYAKEIDNLYADAEKMSTSTPLDISVPDAKIDLKDSSSISQFVHGAVSQLVGPVAFQDEDDLFVRGMLDSLQALRLTRTLKHTFAIPELEITTLYTNPSVASLTAAIIRLSSLHESSKASSIGSRQQVINDSLAEYKTTLNCANANGAQSNGVNGVHDENKKSVILTGSTGALGSYILETLLQTSSVAHIFCLNRVVGKELQMERSQAHGLPTEFSEDRVTFLHADLSQESFGLDPVLFAKIKSSATDIIHNAWPVNFNIPLSTFYPNIRGIINLIELAATASHKPSLMFLSSLSSVGNFEGDVPEIVINDVTVSLPMGYSESKFIAENLLAYAADKLPHVPIIIARVGQIAGPVSTKGIWNKHEWFPSLVLSSIHLGIIPESLDSTDHSEIDWVPIDLVADILVELTFHARSDQIDGAKVYHPVNPVLVSWKSLLPTIIETATFGKRNKMTTVPFAKWIERVRKDAEDLHSKTNFEEMLEKNPAIKLLSFYEGLAKGRGTSILENKRTVQASDKLRGLQGIEGAWVEKWVQGWIQ
ncbi:uncharacterized protein EAE97_005117 [Botrytis byssoidea]|uniref:Carrier domain-containing protein n=1 Tax=Botrytis byssoidea TaxID=139641 RepID=A0A9P5IS57_9HELO|nr:uncharacterized protein EAE97_005117 [Botrytis byssoidea]KAF7946079.1 hypothetical protein EAE97_005117 [Botrytis byssoidea]